MSSKSINSGVGVDILVVGARGIPGVEGGAEKHAEMAFPVLAQRGYRITLIGMRRYIDRRRYKGVELRRVPSVSFAKSDKLIYNFLAAIYALFLRPKIVHLQGLNAAIFLFIYRLFGLKTVLRYSSADRLHKKWGFLGRNVLRLCEAQLRFARTIIVVSENYRADLRKRLKLQNVVVVPNGIDVVDMADHEASVGFWDSFCPEYGRFILTVGRLTVDKGFESLIEAVNAIDDQNLHLFIVGGVSEEEYSKKLHDLADDRVHFLGRLDRNEIHRLYEKCALYVNCSYFEGLSNALLEAISHECPLVVSDIAANVEMPLREESYFPVGDVEVLAERIRSALNQPADFKAKKTDFLSWEDVADLMENVYLNIEPEWRAQ